MHTCPQHGGLESHFPFPTMTGALQSYVLPWQLGIEEKVFPCSMELVLIQKKKKKVGFNL